MKLKQIIHGPTERISQRVLYILMGLVGFVFVLFFFVGFDRPYTENPDFNAPLFTDAVLLLGVFFLLLVVVLVLTRGLLDVRRWHGEGDGYENNVPRRKITRGLLFLLLTVVVFSAFVASAEPLRINDMVFSDRLWLKVADMFIYTGLVLLVAAIAAVSYGATRYKRKGKSK